MVLSHEMKKRLRSISPKPLRSRPTKSPEKEMIHMKKNTFTPGQLEQVAQAFLDLATRIRETP